MSEQFDASLGHSEPLSHELLLSQQAQVDKWAERPSALVNAKLHARNELTRLVNACNRTAWGGTPADMRRPTAGEVGALLQRLDAETCDRLLRDMRLAAEQRSLVMRIEHAEQQVLARIQAAEEEKARREAEQRELAEFEAFDAAGKAERYAAWRAARGL